MKSKGKIRYAVVGIGSIAQEGRAAGIPTRRELRTGGTGFRGPGKAEELGKKYHCQTYRYEQYEECLSSGGVDAVYIAVPNHLHRKYTEPAARKGIHILCEKPLAQNEQECRAIIDAARSGGVKLMTAYRLHFEAANLEAVRICESGEVGEVRIFNSVFCQQVAEGNVRLTQTSEHGGGPLFDMGVYCINAARYLFREEPVEVVAFPLQ
ncbi:MAG: Gfo/Idh/MocA family oxidoreductase [Ignavibacteriota bacterium]